MVNALAKAHPPPNFITVYGGLRWTTTTGRTKNESLYSFWGDTIKALDDGIVPVGGAQAGKRECLGDALPAL